MRKAVYFLCFCACVATAEDNAISFNTIFSDSTGKFSYTYPTALPSHAALVEMQKNFAKQKFGEKFPETDPVAALNLYSSQNKDIEFFSDEVSFPLSGIVQFHNTFYRNDEGSAHGISGSVIGIYSLTNGKKIEMNSLFVKGWEKDVVKLIIREFLLTLNLQLLVDYGYTQKESDFIPEKARFSERGLDFVFPIYKVAPYAAGEQGVFVSWNALKPYLNKKSVIYPKIRFEE